MASPNFLILASASDESAQRLALQWKRTGARVLLVHPQDLSRIGWRYEPGKVVKATLVADGRPIPVTEISGVLTRLARVPEQELLQIAPPDREYAAMEMSAFLVAFLSEIPCAVLNRPSGTCLNGPNWRHEQWIHAAAQAGVPVRVARRLVGQGETPRSGIAHTGARVTVIGETCLGTEDETLHSYARALAKRARVELLSLTFGLRDEKRMLLEATVWADVTEERIAMAMLRHFSRPAQYRVSGKKRS